MLKQDYEIEQQEDEDLRCPVCNYYFSNVTKPYLLPCNHNLCLECIDNIIKKNMLYCPICRGQFDKDARDKFQVNFSFLSLVIKILKTKVIFCSKCSKVFNWADHHRNCDQRQFKETNELFGEVKTLIEDSIRLLKSSDSYMTMLSSSKRCIYTQLNGINKEINDSFVQKCQESIEAFYQSIPLISIDVYHNSIIDFLMLCEPLYANMNVNMKEVNALLSSHSKSKQSDSFKTDMPNQNNMKSNTMANMTTIDAIKRAKSNNRGAKMKPTKKLPISPNVSLQPSGSRHTKMKSCNQNIFIKACSSIAKNSKSKDLETIERTSSYFDIEEFLRDDEEDDDHLDEEVVNIPKIIDTPIRKPNNTLVHQSIIGRKMHEYQFLKSKTIGQVNTNLSTTASTIVINKSQEDEANEFFSQINKIIPLISNVKDLIHKIQSHSRQIDFTTQTIKEQISSNFLCQNAKIALNLNGVIENIKLSESISPRRVLVNYIEKTRKIWLYDSISNSVDTRDFLFIKYKFNQSISIEFDQIDTVYISGGKYNASLFSEDFTYDDKFYAIKWHNQQMNKQNEGGIKAMPALISEGFDFIGQMPRKRAMHSSLFFNSKLYLIGGEGEKKAKLKECECYNAKDKRWELMPLLNYARIKPSLCIYNNNQLYVFQGDTEKISFIEFINLERYDSGWTVVLPDDPGSIWMPASLSSSTIISDSQILICGGASNGNMLSSSYIYDPIKKIVYRGKDICHPAIFSSTGVIYNSKLIAIDLKNGTGKIFGVHIYDIANNNWSFI